MLLSLSFHHYYSQQQQQQHSSSKMQNDGQSVRSRQTGMSRKSSMSRQSQLVKKATGPTDLRPSDILIERFEAWKLITKNLISYFEGAFRLLRSLRFPRVFSPFKSGRN